MTSVHVAMCACRYGLDCVLVSDGVATATVHGGKMIECLSAAVAKGCMAKEIVSHLDQHPELIAPPKAPLLGSVRHGKADVQRGKATKYW